MTVCRRLGLWAAVLVALPFVAAEGNASDRDSLLPTGVTAVWDMNKAYRETTPANERIAINGLWQWQPADEVGETVPADRWGYYKVPAPWSSNSQILYPHPAWKDRKGSDVNVAWYRREIAVPAAWQGRRIAVLAEYLNSYAAVYLDGKKLGEMYFPSGEVDITSACRPGQTQLLSLCVKAVPLAAVMQAFTDTGVPKTVKGSVEFRGLCGDVFLVSMPQGPRIDEVKVNTSVRQWTVALDVGLRGLRPGETYRLRAGRRQGPEGEGVNERRGYRIGIRPEGCPLLFQQCLEARTALGHQHAAESV